MTGIPSISKVIPPLGGYGTLARLCAVLLLLLASSTTFAQVGEFRSDLAIGVNGGMTLNKISFNPTIKQKWKQGATFGATIRYTCERYFGMICAIQAEVNYTQLGWKENIETSPDTYERTVNYVQIPFLASLGFGKEEHGVMGYLVLGPQIGFYLNDKVKTNEWEDVDNPERPNGVTEQYYLPIQNTFEYGLTGGLGMEINTGIGHFMVEGRYYYALSDIFDNGKADYFGRSANGTIIAKISYLFDVIKTKNSKHYIPDVPEEIIREDIISDALTSDTESEEQGIDSEESTSEDEENSSEKNTSEEDTTSSEEVTVSEVQ